MIATERRELNSAEQSEMPESSDGPRPGQPEPRDGREG